MSGPGPPDPRHLEEWRRRRDDARRRTRRGRAWAAGALVVVVAILSGVGAWALVRDDPAPEPPEARAAAPAAATETAVAASPDTAAARPGSTAAAERAATRVAAPIVWIQAGHADPREPGYRDQTGAASGPFGSEVAFTSRLADAVAARLDARGVDARVLPGRVDPIGAPGAAFVSLHHDAPGGRAVVVGATAGTGENYYRGEGGGTPSPTPYPDSAPHRRATTVSPQVERASRDLAAAIAARHAAVYTTANGAVGTFAGVVTSAENPRLGSYYGFFRTGADARVILEAGAAGTDDAFLERTDLIAGAVSAGILDDLAARGLAVAP